ncbi:hypothetical protein D3C71_2219650 [compost metagenome]
MGDTADLQAGFLNQPVDAVGGFNGLAGQLADLVGHYAEPSTMLAGAGSFNGGIQG